MPLKELLPRLDPQRFWQVHLHLRGLPERLPVSRQFQPLFKGQ